MAGWEKGADRDRPLAQAGREEGKGEPAPFHPAGRRDSRRRESPLFPLPLMDSKQPQEKESCPLLGVRVRGGVGRITTPSELLQAVKGKKEKRLRRGTRRTQKEGLLSEGKKKERPPTQNKNRRGGRSALCVFVRVLERAVPRST